MDVWMLMITIVVLPAIRVRIAADVATSIS